MILKLIYCSHTHCALEPVLLKFEVCRLGQQKVKKCKIYVIMTEKLSNVDTVHQPTNALFIKLGKV